MIENAGEKGRTWEDVTRISAAELEEIERRRDVRAAREACEQGQCWCHEVAMPYALFAFGLFVFLPVVALAILWATR